MHEPLDLFSCIHTAMDACIAHARSSFCHSPLLALHSGAGNKKDSPRDKELAGRKAFPHRAANNSNHTKNKTSLLVIQTKPPKLVNPPLFGTIQVRNMTSKTINRTLAAGKNGRTPGIRTLHQAPKHSVQRKIIVVGHLIQNTSRDNNKKNFK